MTGVSALPGPLALAQAEFAALGRLMGVDGLLDGWQPELTAADWMAVAQGLWARGILTLTDDQRGFTVAPTHAALLGPVLGADRALMAVASSEGRDRALLVIGDAEAAVACGSMGDGQPGVGELRAVGDRRVDALLEVVNLAAVAPDEPAADQAIGSEFTFAELLSALEQLAADQAQIDQPEAADDRRDFVRALAAAPAGYRVEQRRLSPDGTVDQLGCAWVDGGADGCWEMRVGSEGVWVRRATANELRTLVDAVLDS